MRKLVEESHANSKLVDAKAGSRCFLMFEWKWLELASFFFFFPQSVLPRKQESSCFKHLQMVMHQQLVSVHGAIVGVLKDRPELEMYCQPPLQSWGTFSLEKKVLYSCERSWDGSHVESVPCLAEEAPWARAAEMLGDREAWS